jgi:hypothetical protein
MARTRDTEAGTRVSAWVYTHPGKFTVAECADGAGVAASTASGRLRAMLQVDPSLTLVRRGHYHYHGQASKPAGSPLKIGDVLEVTGTADGRWLVVDSDGNQWALVAFRIKV